MTGTVADFGAPISRRIVALWPLSLALPQLLSTVIQSAIFALGQEEMVFQSAVVLPFFAWLLTGYMQFRLLRAHLRRSLLWLITTAAGGYLASLAGGFAQIHAAAMVQSFVLNGEGIPDWLFLYHPAVSIAAAVALGATLLGFLQSFCLDDTIGRRVLWLFAAAASGVVAAIFGFVCYALYWQLVLERYFGSDVIDRGLWPYVIAATVGVISTMIVYGFLTGIVLRWLLIRRARQRQQTLADQFD